MARVIDTVRVIREVHMQKDDIRVDFCSCCKQTLPLRLSLIAAKRIADALKEAGIIDGM